MNSGERVCLSILQTSYPKGLASTYGTKADKRRRKLRRPNKNSKKTYQYFVSFVGIISWIWSANSQRNAVGKNRRQYKHLKCSGSWRQMNNNQQTHKQ